MRDRDDLPKSSPREAAGFRVLFANLEDLVRQNNWQVSRIATCYLTA